MVLLYGHVMTDDEFAVNGVNVCVCEFGFGVAEPLRTKTSDVFYERSFDCLGCVCVRDECFLDGFSWRSKTGSYVV